MVVLIADNGEDPGTERLAVDGLGAPGTVGLLGRRLELGGGALVGLTAAVTDQVAADDLAALLVVAGHLVAVGTGLDNLVAIFLEGGLEVLEQILESRVRLAGADVDGAQDAEHGRNRTVSCRGVSWRFVLCCGRGIVSCRVVLIGYGIERE